MKERIVDSAKMMGLPPNVDMQTIFTNMSKMLDVMKSKIDEDDSIV